MKFNIQHGHTVSLEMFQGELHIEIQVDEIGGNAILTYDQASKLRDYLCDELDPTQPSMDVIIDGQVCKRPIQKREVLYARDVKGNYIGGDGHPVDTPVLRHGEELVRTLSGPPMIIKSRL